MKILAIDFGLKRMGFAVGNSMLKTAVPIQQIARRGVKKDLTHINGLIGEYDINKIIIGYPLNMDGSKNRMTAEVEKFAKHLKKKTGLTIAFINEALSSFEAEEYLMELKKDYKKRKEILDSISAFIILRDYLGQK